MARPPKPDAQIVEAPIDEAAFVQAGESLNTLALANSETSAGAQALAVELGYDGALSVGALEDEIRFYQRRTVEACLELSKRLLLLKEITPHGEFERRVDMLGIEKTKAHRFMKSAAATAKNCNLQLLTGQVKSFSAFWEIVMTDDDVIENVMEWDDIDRMSASQLRAALRDAREEAETKDARRGELVAQNEKLKEQLVRIKRAGPDEALEAARAEAATILSEVLGRVRGDFRHALQVLSGMDAKEDIFLAGMVGQVVAELALLREQFDLPDLSNARDAQLAADVAKWAPQAGA